jgi:GTP-binding protein
VTPLGDRGPGTGDRATPPLHTEFVGSFPDPLQPLDPPLPEIALLGRSNVGKSSLLNALAGRRRGALARVSAAPGKTDLLNVYRTPRAWLLDLPGYGWARRSQSARAGFRRLLEGVATRRTGLSGVLWLLDIRHPPSDDDHAIRDLLAGTGRPVLVVLTKADKLPQARRAAALGRRAEELGLERAELLLTSSHTGLGIADLRESIAAVTGNP